MTERAGLQLGNYRLLQMLGEGGFADVYLGEHIHLKSLAAIKVLYTRLTSELQESFLTEARILAQLVHPHIIRILDFGVEEDVPYLIMDYAPHGALRKIHPLNTKLPLPTVVEYVRQIADGLQYAHDKKLIHRDLKPDNVLLGQRDDLLISDFGVALIAESTRSTRNAEEGFAGTASYMAPEQLRGQPQFASDQYSLGIMVYEWLCGVRPFRGTVIELYAQHHSTAPAPLREYTPQLPSEVEQVVLRALEKEPEKRFPDVTAFATELEQASRAAQSTGNSQFIALPVVTPQHTGRATTDDPTKLLSFAQLGLATQRYAPADTDQSAIAIDGPTRRVSPASSQLETLRAAPVPDSSIADNPTKRLPTVSQPQTAISPDTSRTADQAMSPPTPIPDIPTTPLPDLPTNQIQAISQPAIFPETASQGNVPVPLSQSPENSYTAMPPLQTGFTSSTPSTLQANSRVFVEPETPLPFQQYNGPETPLPIQSYANAMVPLSNQVPEPGTEAAPPQKRSSIGKAVLLAGLAVLLITGAVFAATLYSTRNSSQKGENGATATPSTIVTVGSTTTPSTSGLSTPMPTSTSSSTVPDSTPTANVTAPVSNPLPTAQPSPTVAVTPTIHPTVAATPTKHPTVAATPTTRPSPTPSATPSPTPEPQKTPTPHITPTPTVAEATPTATNR
jgi:serine/threonine protein kinase